jgi:hypothetical protein
MPFNILKEKKYRIKDRFTITTSPHSENYHPIRLNATEQYRKEYDGIFRKASGPLCGTGDIFRKKKKNKLIE